MPTKSKRVSVSKQKLAKRADLVEDVAVGWQSKARWGWKRGKTLEAWRSSSPGCGGDGSRRQRFDAGRGCGICCRRMAASAK